MTDDTLRSRSVDCRAPDACTAEQLDCFERLVREAFAGSDDELPGRIAAADTLAFHPAQGAPPVAIAGLKTPREEFRNDVFRKAGAEHDAAHFRLELGWVYVVPARRGRGVAETLCRSLMARAGGRGVFATTRPDNHAMMRILVALGFVAHGNPYRHVRRDEMLRLWLRPRSRTPASYQVTSTRR